MHLLARLHALAEAEKADAVNEHVHHEIYRRDERVGEHAGELVGAVYVERRLHVHAHYIGEQGVSFIRHVLRGVARDAAEKYRQPRRAEQQLLQQKGDNEYDKKDERKVVGVVHRHGDEEGEQKERRHRACEP